MCALNKLNLQRVVCAWVRQRLGLNTLRSYDSNILHFLLCFLWSYPYKWIHFRFTRGCCKLTHLHDNAFLLYTYKLYIKGKLISNPVAVCPVLCAERYPRVVYDQDSYLDCVTMNIRQVSSGVNLSRRLMSSTWLLYAPKIESHVSEFSLNKYWKIF